MVVRTSARPPSVQDFAGAAYAHLLLVENLLKLQFDLISIHTQTHVKNGWELSYRLTSVYYYLTT